MGPGARLPLDQLNIGANHFDTVSQLNYAATSLDAFKTWIKQGLNAIEGPGGSHFVYGVGNPSEGLDTGELPLGIIPALGARVALKDPYAEDALLLALLARALALRALDETDARAIQRRVKVVALLLQAALTSYP